MNVGRILVLTLAVVAVVVPLSAYVTAYIELGEHLDWRLFAGYGGPNQVQRHYQDREWCVIVFAPAAAVESKWIGCPVYLTHKRPPPIEWDTGLMPP